MKKTRTTIPKAVGEDVLKEFHHKCAVCGRHDPHLHHIDENPSNNDRSNLLPLCPNCHLQDTHDPTSPPDPKKLKLFRAHKDPLILDPRFHPIFRRMQCAFASFENEPSKAAPMVNEFLNFIEQLAMGAFYKRQILIEFNQRTRARSANATAAQSNVDPALIKKAINDVFELRIEALTIEMLRYQGWTLATQNSP